MKYINAKIISGVVFPVALLLSGCGGGAGGGTTTADTTAPITMAVLSASGTNDNSTTISVTIDEKGVGYYLVRLDTDPVPAIETVKAGTAFEMRANEAASKVISGLTPGTDYVIYFIAKDAENNWQPSSQHVTVTTLYPASWVQQGALLWQYGNTPDTWTKANEFCNGFPNGGTGWRLPTVDELKGLRDSGELVGHEWDIATYNYWSSEAAVQNNYYKTFSLYDGNVYTYFDWPDSPQSYVCVRNFNG